MARSRVRLRADVAAFFPRNYAPLKTARMCRPEPTYGRGEIKSGESMRPPSNTIGRRLAAIRKDRGLTQAEVGAWIGKSKTSVFAWERGLYEIKLADAQACAGALRCSLKDLLAAVDAPLPAVPARWPRTRRRSRQCSELLVEMKSPTSAR